VVNWSVQDKSIEEDQNRLELSWGNTHQSKKDFHHAQKGNHLMVPFECDEYVFVKLCKFSTSPYNQEKDKLLLACIQRANMDSFWSRASSTVTVNGDRVRAALVLSDSVDLQGAYENHGVMTYNDHCSYEVANQMLLASRKPGKHSAMSSQWETNQKLQAIYSNQSKSLVQFNSTVVALGDDREQAKQLVKDRCASLWFASFLTGCRRGKVQDLRPKEAMRTRLIVQMLKLVANQIEGAIESEGQMKWIVFGTFSVLAYVFSLQRAEYLLVDFKGMLKYEDKGNKEYFIDPLLGKVKGKH
jgi:hypothetical protein